MNCHANIGEGVRVDTDVTIGYLYDTDAPPACLTGPAIVRSGSIIYAGVVADEHLSVGHNVLIREQTVIGKHVTVGTNVVIEGHVEIGNFVKIESNCFIPTHTSIGDRVFIGPNVVMANDKYPLRLRSSYSPQGPTIEEGVTLGAGVIILPGVTVGQGSFVAAGAVVIGDVPPMSLVMGTPGRVSQLPEKLCENNMALSWRGYIHEKG